MKYWFKRSLKIFKGIVVGVVLIISIISIVRFFVFDVYYVPTASMDQTIMPGELILANKFSYGARWFSKSGVTRLPSMDSVKRNDIVVFNFPEGDTVYVEAPTENYYLFKRRRLFGNKDIPFDAGSEKCFLPLASRIAYVKRCIGMPGDTLQVKEGQVIINGEILEDCFQYNRKYKVTGALEVVAQKLLSAGFKQFWRPKNKDSVTVVMALPEKMQVWRQENSIFKVKQVFMTYFMANIFPVYSEKSKKWRYDRYGVLYIPKAGDVITLNDTNLPIYERLITVYEGNSLKLNGGVYFINGEKTDRYTVQQNYYFMMGDNRYFSIDSRSWGFVPADHVIGKAQLVLHSKDDNDNVRWNRLGTVLE